MNSLGFLVLRVLTWFKTRISISDDRGAAAVEYGVMVALIAAVIIATVVVLGGQIKTAFCTVVTNLGGLCP